MNNNFAKSVIGSVVLAAVLSGCSSETPEKLVGSAKGYLEKNDRKAALIQLKTAIQKNGNLSEARFLLAKTLSEMGDQEGALIELSKASQLGYPDEEVQPLEARVLILQGEMAKIVEKFANPVLKGAESQSDLLTSLAVAHSSLGHLTDARKTIDLALKLSPRDVRARLTEARLRAAEGRVDEAFAQVIELSREQPKRSDVALLLGEFQEAKGDVRAAIASYRKAVDLDSVNYVAQSRALAALIGQQDYKEAQIVWESMNAKIPNNLNTAYFGVLLAFERGELKLAEERLQPLLKYGAANGRVLYLAGAVYFQKGAMTQAETYLGKAMSTSLGEAAPGVRTLLARVLIRIGNPAKAWVLIQPLLERSPVDAEALAVGAEASLKLGEFARAETLFKQVVQVNPNDSRARTFLAVERLKKGDVESGIQELRAISEREKAVTADLALISSLISKKDYVRALEAVSNLEKKDPKSPDAANLRGQIELQRGDVARAREAFEAAMKLDSQSFVAAHSLADLDVRNQRVDLALARFERMSAENPKNISTRMAVVGLREQMGAKASDLIAVLSEVVKDLPAEVAPRVQLSRFYLRSGDTTKALALAQDTITQLPNRPEGLELLADAYASRGDFIQAENQLSKLILMQPKSVKPLLSLAKMHVANNKFDAAISVLRKAMLLQPDNRDVQSALVSVLAGSGKADDAYKLCQQIQKSYPKLPLGWALAGDVAAFKKDWGAAVDWYRKALQVDGRHTDVAIKLHKSLLMAKDVSAADSFAQQRSQALPNDAIFTFYLGDVALSRKDFAQAERWYGAVLKMQPENVGALNNMAWLYNKSKRPQAKELAERAQRLQPRSAGVLDTLSEIHSDQGDFAKAVELQRKAVDLDGSVANYRLNLVKRLLAAGQKDQAKSEYEKLGRERPEYARSDEYRQLAKSL